MAGRSKDFYGNYPGAMSYTTSAEMISPFSHSARSSKGRQQISQSVVKVCDGTEVSTATSNDWPQNGH